MTITKVRTHIRPREKEVKHVAKPCKGNSYQHKRSKNHMEYNHDFMREKPLMISEETGDER